MKSLHTLVALSCAGILASALAGCGGGSASGAGAPLPAAALPDVQPPLTSSSQPLHVTEVTPQPSDVNGSIAVDSTGAVYFGVYNAGLDRYSGGTFTVTGPNVAGAGPGIVSVLPANKVVWGAITSEPNTMRDFTVLQCSGNGGTAAACPSDLYPPNLVTSVVADASGRLWAAGGTSAPGDIVFQVAAQGTGPVPYSAPLNSPFGQSGKVLIGPGGDVWGAGTGSTSTSALEKFTVVNATIQASDMVTIPGTHDMNDVVYGPDGRFWFTDVASNAIDAVTPSGQLTAYAIPTANSTPYHITVGPDGALWFTENTGNKIGRIDVSGHITEYAIPTADSQPTGIAATPSACGTKAIWFVESNAKKLGEILLGS